MLTNQSYNVLFRPTLDGQRRDMITTVGVTIGRSTNVGGISFQQVSSIRVAIQMSSICTATSIAATRVAAAATHSLCLVTTSSPWTTSWWWRIDPHSLRGWTSSTFAIRVLFTGCQASNFLLFFGIWIVVDSSMIKTWFSWWLHAVHYHHHDNVVIVASLDTMTTGAAAADDASASALEMNEQLTSTHFVISHSQNLWMCWLTWQVSDKQSNKKSWFFFYGRHIMFMKVPSTRIKLSWKEESFETSMLHRCSCPLLSSSSPFFLELAPFDLIDVNVCQSLLILLYPYTHTYCCSTIAAAAVIWLHHLHLLHHQRKKYLIFRTGFGHVSTDLIITMTKAYEFNWRREVPPELIQGGLFDRWEEVSHPAHNYNWYY